MSRPLWARIKQQVPPSNIQVRVTAKQFNWEILYPGPDGTFDTADDVQMDNELYVPVNRVVQVFLASKDVIHSFFLPNLRLKQDVVPGRTIQAWFEATKPGVYEIPCAELCGFGHSGMLGYLTVYSAEDYEKWVKEQWPPS
jgi:cytochrome c oxidase subunit 2